MSKSNTLPLPGSYAVKEGQLLAGPYPGTWNMAVTRDRLFRFLDVGVTYFLDLTDVGEIEPYALFLPRTVTYQRISVHDMTVPAVPTMIRILDTIDAAIAEGQMVYAHCLAGLGRTGTVIGCYLVRHGMDGRDALQEIVCLRGGAFDSPQTDAQRVMVRQWAALETQWLSGAADRKQIS